MNTPVYREMVRLLNNKMNVSRNTVYNWFVKGSDCLKKLLPVLKEKLLAKGTVVNCDETWCRVKVAGKYGKKYIWCMAFSSKFTIFTVLWFFDMKINTSPFSVLRRCFCLTISKSLGAPQRMSLIPRTK